MGTRVRPGQDVSWGEAMQEILLHLHNPTTLADLIREPK